MSTAGNASDRKPTTRPETSCSLAARYRNVRGLTDRLIETLEPEDCVVQSMPDVSPTRWHLAHTTWFFETFVLKPTEPHQDFDPRFEYLFNSYYNSVGAQFPRSERGLLSRPTVSEVLDYRCAVDRSMAELLEDDRLTAAQQDVVELGLQHEQQHQELMLTDIKHVFSRNPLAPVYRAGAWSDTNETRMDWIPFDEGVYEIGWPGNGFCFDNELPRHRVFLEPYLLASRLVTAGEYLEFIEDDGYRRPELWLSAGWSQVQAEGWEAPLYWKRSAGDWRVFTLSGEVELNPALPVCHVSYFEADAFARWAEARLPTEAEWEVAAAGCEMTGGFVDRLLAAGRTIHPGCATSTGGLQQMYGDVWEWTSSSYSAYPGYRVPDGALGEYNGKFMCNQYVLRGGSCATSSDHIRPTYRNFFPTEARWQFSGFRLARSC